jgi:hypothetical protein
LVNASSDIFSLLPLLFQISIRLARSSTAVFRFNAYLANRQMTQPSNDIDFLF